tara:strand:+ start:767 stop:955 length:189 start_codon:yes stop_codon:yes gene_type:complete
VFSALVNKSGQLVTQWFEQSGFWYDSTKAKQAPLRQELLPISNQKLRKSNSIFSSKHITEYG